MSQDHRIEVLQQGLQDEMNSAFQYIALAGKHGSNAVKQDFFALCHGGVAACAEIIGLIGSAGQ